MKNLIFAMICILISLNVLAGDNRLEEIKHEAYELRGIVAKIKTHLETDCSGRSKKKCYKSIIDKLQQETKFLSGQTDLIINKLESLSGGAGNDDLGCRIELLDDKKYVFSVGEEIVESSKQDHPYFTKELAQEILDWQEEYKCENDIVFECKINFGDDGFNRGINVWRLYVGSFKENYNGSKENFEEIKANYQDMGICLK